MAWSSAVCCSGPVRAQHLSNGLGGHQRIERMNDHCVGLRPHRQPAIVPAFHRNDHRRPLRDLVLELPKQAHPSGRLCLAVEDGQINTTRVDLGQHLGYRAGLDIPQATHVRSRTPPDSVDDGLADLWPVTEYQYCGGVAWDVHPVFETLAVLGAVPNRCSVVAMSVAMS